jgi:hypothetical protein
LDIAIAQENIWRVNGDENKLTYFRRPLLSKDALMFIHQVTRFAGFLSDFAPTIFPANSVSLATLSPELAEGTRGAGEKYPGYPLPCEIFTP